MIKWYDEGFSPPDILLLGDSVAERVSNDDLDKRTLAEIIQDKIGTSMTMGSLSHSAYHPGIFYRLIALLSTLKKRPRLIILPINIRCFSPQWDLNPAWQFPREETTLDTLIRSRSPENQGPLNLPAERNINPPHALTPKDFSEMAVTYPLTSYLKIGQFLEVVSQKPHETELKIARLRDIFIFHYLHHLREDHRKLIYLKNSLHLLNQLKISTLIYITPINYRAGAKYAGKRFTQLVKANLATINRVAASTSTPRQLWANFAFFLDSRYFFKPTSATEHLNQEGRYILADKVSRLIRQILSERSISSIFRLTRSIIDKLNPVATSARA